MRRNASGIAFNLNAGSPASGDIASCNKVHVSSGNTKRHGSLLLPEHACPGLTKRIRATNLLGLFDDVGVSWLLVVDLRISDESTVLYKLRMGL